ncbi:hypothetical protein EVAR_16701_1 [Eumeta japonica]|uniref:Uncharacterized protein n=1 Tax=Eumeta variegata TaxID=151549 RepID=A0A4C1V641_EUMVA|nr:hypothetical protein EVAR_16701_1 [Eumeta japonica]
MNFIERQNLKLWPRNEGKLKYYESCTDVRAWSHDLRSRDCYLKEWMKCDMPVNVLPTATLFSYMQNVVSNKYWGKAVPRCHPACKSKTILESLCKTSATMKGCLKQDGDFQKYFDQEEFETSHWPCEKYLEVLKNIKMFWKIISDKIFKIRIQRTEFSNDHGDGSLQSLVRNWEKGMVQEAIYVKNITRCSSNLDDVECTGKCSKQISFKCNKDNIDKERVTDDLSHQRKVRYETNGYEEEKVNSSYNKRNNRLNNKYVTVKIKTADKSCDSCNFQNDTSELEMLKNKFNYIQQRFIEQKCAMENLRKVNGNLTAKLETLERKKLCHKSTNMPDDAADWSETDVKTINLSPKKRNNGDYYANDISENHLKGVESEIIITMKSCKNKGEEVESNLIRFSAGE